jgi:hypothetical protein
MGAPAATSNTHMADQKTAPKTYRTQNGEKYSRSLAVTRTKQVKGRLEDYDVDVLIEFGPTYTTSDPGVQAAIEEMGEFGARVVEQGATDEQVRAAQATVVVGGASVGGAQQVVTPAALPPAEPTPTEAFQQGVTAPSPELVAEAPMTGGSVDEAAATLIRDYGVDPSGLRDGTGFSAAAVAGAYQALGIPVEISHEGPAVQRNHPASPPPNVAPLPDVTGTMAGPVGAWAAEVASAAQALVGTDPAEPLAGNVADSDGSQVSRGTTDETGDKARPSRSKKG